MSNSTCPHQISGRIPPNRDQEFSWSDEDISGINERIDACRDDYIRSLDLGNSNLSTVPERLKDLTHLKRLWLEFNDLEDLPASLASLKELVLLDLSHNRLTKLPDWVLDLKPECKVRVWDNSFSQDEIGRLSEIISKEGYSGPKVLFTEKA